MGISNEEEARQGEEDKDEDEKERKEKGGGDEGVEGREDGIEAGVRQWTR